MYRMLFTILTVIFFAIAAQAQVTITNTNRYYTAEQMLLANEINESGEPYAEDLGYNLDDLDPFNLNTPDSTAYTLGIENYEYSRYQLGTIISRSGMGLHLMWAPVIRQMAAMEQDADFDGKYTPAPNGFKEDDELIKNIMHFSMLSHHAPPGHPWPQFAEFVSGNPHLPQPIDPEKFAWEDFSTLRWDRSQMDKTLSLSAMGQSLMKQYLWAQDMLGGFHDADDNPIDPDGTVSPDFPNNPHFDPNNNVYYGGDGLDGFVGMVLTAEAINKVKFTLMQLGFDGQSLGMIDPMTYDPRAGLKYFPHKISVTEHQVHPMLPPRAASFSVTDAHSDLWDQVSFLWGTLNFMNMMNPMDFSDPAHLAYKEVFDGDPFPPAMAQSGMPGPFDLMMGASKVVFQNILAMHHRPIGFVDQAIVTGGRLHKGRHISAVNAGYLLVVLAKFQQEFKNTPLAARAKAAVIQEGNFVLTRLLKRNGRVANGFTMRKGVDHSRTKVESQAAAIRGLYAAYLATGKMWYLRGADLAYRFLIQNFYVANMHAFRTTLNMDKATYTPLRFAVIAGALREADLVGNHAEASQIYVCFFKKVANKMQLSEGAPTGESGGDSDGDGIPYIPEQPDNLPPVFASEATLMLTSSMPKVQINSADGIETLNSFELIGNFPNPFNPTTSIQYQIPKDSQVELVVYDINGKQVRTLVQEYQTSGSHSVQWNGKDAQGRALSSGIYLYRLKAGSNVQVRKMTLLK